MRTCPACGAQFHTKLSLQKEIDAVVAELIDACNQESPSRDTIRALSIRLDALRKEQKKYTV